MPVSAAIIDIIQKKLNVAIKSYSPVSGGDINRVYRLRSSNHDYLIKVNSRYDFPDMFRHEAFGLLAIKDSRTIAVPDIIMQDDVDDDSFILLEWIDTMSPASNSMYTLGLQLAQMHRSNARQFGFVADNYMGSLVQSNRWHNTWANFFIEERLQPMVKMAVDNGELGASEVMLFDTLYKKLPSLFDEEPPALIHGDLWSGNYLIGTNGIPYLIDPAVSYGNREFDIAMTTLFGGFDNIFYQAYHEAFPLQTGWQQRLKLWNLYPLLVHVNLFGGGYVRQVKQNLATFT